MPGDGAPTGEGGKVCDTDESLRIRAMDPEGVGKEEERLAGAGVWAGAGAGAGAGEGAGIGMGARGEVAEPGVPVEPSLRLSDLRKGGQSLASEDDDARHPSWPTSPCTAHAAEQNKGRRQLD
jgi:hypothetical protein